MPPKKTPIDRSKPSPKIVEELAALIRREVSAQLGPNSTFEQRREAGARVMSEVLAEVSDEFRVEVEARTKEGG